MSHIHERKCKLTLTPMGVMYWRVGGVLGVDCWICGTGAWFYGVLWWWKNIFKAQYCINWLSLSFPGCHVEAFYIRMHVDGVVSTGSSSFRCCSLFADLRLDYSSEQNVYRWLFIYCRSSEPEKDFNKLNIKRRFHLPAANKTSVYLRFACG